MGPRMRPSVHCAVVALTAAISGRPGHHSALAFAPPRSLSSLLSVSGRTLADGRRGVGSGSLPRETGLSAEASSSLAREGDWHAYLDEDTTGLIYYFNFATGESVWEPPTTTFPVPKLEGWRERRSRRKKREYKQSEAWMEAKRNAAQGVLGELGSFVEGAIREAATIRQAENVQQQQQAAPAWTWRGYRIYTEVIPPGDGAAGGRAEPPAALLVHGFGASTTYWRAAAAALSDAGFEVHALDLLGQGRSDKPHGDGVVYSVRLWAELVDDYARKFLSGGGGRREIYLIGHSLGSLVVLAVASGDHVPPDDNDSFGGGRGEGFLSRPGRVSGMCLFNCGIGLNARNIVDDTRYNPLQRAWILAVFAATNALVFNNPPVLRFVIETLVTPGLLRFSLRSTYKHDPSRVDDALVESFYRPSRDVDGAVEAVRQIYTNDPGLTPMELHRRRGDALARIPTHLVWGDEDDVTPLTGSVGRFYADMATRTQATGVTMEVVPAGHVPFDDNPVESNGSMLRWLETTRGQTAASKGGPGWLSGILR